MKKFIMSGLLLVSNFLLFFISAMLISVLPGLLTEKLAMDRQTGIRFISIYLILYLLIFSLLIILKNIDLKNINSIIKIQYSILFILYMVMILFFNFIISKAYIHYINFIPFKSIFTKMHDFLIIPDRFTFYSFFRTIVFYIIYLIPLFIVLKNKINEKYYFLIVLLSLVLLEIVNFIIKKNFDIDNIFLGLYGACLVKYIFKEGKTYFYS